MFISKKRLEKLEDRIRSLELDREFQQVEKARARIQLLTPLELKFYNHLTKNIRGYLSAKEIDLFIFKAKNLREVSI